MSKFLIINADDYGYNEAQTRAITELYNEKLITSSSFLAVTDYSEAAAKAALENNITLGVHLTVNSDKEENRWHSLTDAKSLSDKKGMYTSQLDIALHGRKKDVYNELEAQYRFLTERGCTVDHADNHCATLYGINGRTFYKEAYKFCAAHKLPYRFPKTPDFLDRQMGRKLPKPVYALHKRIVKAGERYGVKMLDDLVSNPYSINRIENYESLRKYYLDALDNCADGVTEFFLHPAYPADEGGEWEKRVYELKLLKSGDLLQKAEDKGIIITSWRIFDELYKTTPEITSGYC